LCNAVDSTGDRGGLASDENLRAVSAWNSLSDPHPLPLFSQVFILKGVKVLCFDTLLQVLILKGVRGGGCGPVSYASAGHDAGLGSGKRERTQSGTVAGKTGRHRNLPMKRHSVVRDFSPGARDTFEQGNSSRVVGRLSRPTFDIKRWRSYLGSDVGLNFELASHA
jgi:hypothetical protein